MGFVLVVVYRRSESTTTYVSDGEKRAMKQTDNKVWSRVGLRKDATEVEQKMGDEW